MLPKGGAGVMGVEDGAHKAFASARTQMYVQDADQVCLDSSSSSSL